MWAVINDVSFINYLDLKITDSTEITGKHMKFSGNRTAKGAEGSFSVYNFTPNFKDDGELEIEIWGGFKDNTFLIFKGDVASITTGKEGVDRFHTFKLIDGANLDKASNFKSYASNTLMKNIVSDMLDDLKKAGAEMADQILDKIKTLLGNDKTVKTKARKKIIEGINTVLSGASKEAEIVKHNGIIDILIENELGGAVIDLKPGTGLIGDISAVFDTKKKKNVITCQSFMFSDFRIGQGIQTPKGFGNIRSIGYDLSSWQVPFYADLELI